MRVKELTLHNFRGIKDLHLAFNTEHNVVVLVGVNGVGKSSILDCINLLMQYYGKAYAEYIQSHYFGKQSLVINTGLLSSDININSNSTFNEAKIIFDESNNIELSISESKDHDDNEVEDYPGELTYNKLIKNIEGTKCEELVDRYFYYLANRQVVNFQDTGKTKANSIVDFKAFSKWFKETEDLENEMRLSNNIEYRHPVLETVRQAVYSLLGEDYSNLRFKREIDKATIKKLGKEIAVELLSDGEKSLLAMVGHLSKRLTGEYNSFGDSLGKSAIILIDEIELHLHPGWQRIIIPRLTKTFPNCQFIVTTHSPQVLSHVNPECIHILDYDGDNVVVKRPNSSYGLDSNRILEDILGVSKRPQEIQDRMLELFRTINNNDLESAKKIAKELGDQIGINEPELVKAEATIKRREIIGR
jgi:predicted ATP-binding protein involved in virulence